MYTVDCMYTQFDFHKAGLVKDLLECNYCITLEVSVLVCTDEAFFYLPCGYALQHQFFLLYPVSYTNINDTVLFTAVQLSAYSLS